MQNLDQPGKSQTSKVQPRKDLGHQQCELYPDSHVQIFPFSEYWWFYLAFVGFVLALLGLDLGVFHRKAHAISVKEALTWSAIWISLALLFNFGFYQYLLWSLPENARLMSIAGFEPALAAKNAALEFLTGFVVEKSLAVDNLFVFVVVFRYFQISSHHQHRILFYGIIGALLFRAIFIALGAVLMQYEAVVVFFGAFLIFTGVKLVFTGDKPMEPERTWVMRLARRVLPISTDHKGPDFFVREHGRWLVTPVFLTLLFLEASDIIFAIDSVPAIFAVTKEPLLVFTSNIFAILGLRSLYFLLANMMDRFHLLKYGLSAVLSFVGLKMVWLNQMFDGHFPIGVSLGVIGGILAVTMALSLLLPKRT